MTKMVAETSDTVNLGPVTLRNRLALAPVKTFFGQPDGKVSPRHMAFCRRHAEGGAGLLIVEPGQVFDATQTAYRAISA